MRACFGWEFRNKPVFFLPIPHQQASPSPLTGEGCLPAGRRGVRVIYRICHSCESRNPYHFLNLYMDSRFHGNDRPEKRAKEF